MTDVRQPPSLPQPPPWNGQPWGGQPTGRPTPPPQLPSNSAATTGIVLASVALLFGLVAGGALTALIAITAITAITVSIVGIAAFGRTLTGRGRAITGVVLGVLALLLVGIHAQGPSTSASSSSYRAATGSSGGSGGSGSSGYSAAAPTSAAPARTPIRTQNFSGRGDEVVDLTKESGMALVTFTCSKCTSNTIVKTDGPDMLLVNTIGAYSGTRLIDAESNSVTSRITINAEGAWTLSVHDIDDARRSSGALSGRGDEVVVVDGSATKARITNARGESNFIVKTTDSDGDQDLAVNQIGGYSGTVPLSAPAVVEVQSDGEWSITPQ